MKQQNTEMTFLPREQVDSQIKAHLAPISQQLVDLARLIQAFDSN